MANADVTIDNSSLVIKIEYNDYLSLSEFKDTIEGWNNQYNAFISQCNDDEKEDKLLIKEIRKGSIEIVLFPALVPLLSDVNTVINFFKAIKIIFTWLSSKMGSKPKLNVSDLNNTKKIIAPVNNHEGNQITFSIEGGKNTFVIDSVLAKKITQNANDEIASFTKTDNPIESDDIKGNVIFKLTQIKDDENPNKNTKGIIQEIDNKEHTILFSSVELKEIILHENSNPFRKNYLIDVKTNAVDDVIKSYTILALHDSYIDEGEENIDLFS
jgi:hypothetical protein